MKIGYVRVSTEEQNTDLQLDALKSADCDRIFEDHGIPAVGKARPAFEETMETLRSGDSFVIWKMDRAFRSLKHALDVLEELEVKGVEFQSLTDHIDTSTPMGKCMYQIRNAFSELERSLISERTKAGMAATKARGVHVGRPHKLTREQTLFAREEIDSGRSTIARMAGYLKVSPTTLDRYLKRL